MNYNSSQMYSNAYEPYFYPWGVLGNPYNGGGKYFSFSGTTVVWYCDGQGNAIVQENRSNSVYYYCGIN